MHREVKLKVASTNYSTKPSKSKFYIRILNVTSSVEDKYEEFIKLRPILIQGIVL